jgi:hypothetical protein
MNFCLGKFLRSRRRFFTLFVLSSLSLMPRVQNSIPWSPQGQYRTKKLFLKNGVTLMTITFSSKHRFYRWKQPCSPVNWSKSKYIVLSRSLYWKSLKLASRLKKINIMLGKAGKWLTRIGTWDTWTFVLESSSEADVVFFVFYSFCTFFTEFNAYSAK